MRKNNQKLFPGQSLKGVLCLLVMSLVFMAALPQSGLARTWPDCPNDNPLPSPCPICPPPPGPGPACPPLHLPTSNNEISVPSTPAGPFCPSIKPPSPPNTVIGGTDSGNDGIQLLSVGDPIDFSHHGSVFERVTDFSIPVKHDLSLDVHRVFSTKEIFDENQNGHVALGYSHGGDSLSNWHLSYEIHIERLTNSFRYVGVNGEWISFSYGGSTTTLYDQKLRDPSQSSSQVIAVTAFYAGNYGYNRQTLDDVTLYVLHDVDRANQTEVMDPAHIVGYALRYANGRQYNFYGENVSGLSGRLHYIDANWRNNVMPTGYGAVDDYLCLTWIPSYTHDADSWSPSPTSPNCWTISTVSAPPSDGRVLRFNHPRRGLYDIYTEISSVDLVCGSSTYSDLVRYTYRDSGMSMGKLWRVRKGNNSAYGVQYDYGQISWNNDQPELDEVSSQRYLAMISQFQDLGNDLYQVTPLIVNECWLNGFALNVTQWKRDPVESWWRKVVDMSYTTVAYGGGDRKNYPDDPLYRYNSDKTSTDAALRTTCDIEQFTVSNAPNPSQQVRHTFIDGTRLVDQTQVLVGTNWVTVEDYDYCGGFGVDQVSKITRYSSTDPASAQVTEVEYKDASRPDAPSRVYYPDGRSIDYYYNFCGQLAGYDLYQKNTTTGSYEIQRSAAIDYNSDGVNAGLPYTIRMTWPGVKTVTTNITYTQTDGNKAGLIASVTTDGKTVSYTYDDFGNVLTAQNSIGTVTIGTVTNVYSGVGQSSDTTLPPRLLSSQGPDGVTTAYTYDAMGRLSSVTADSNHPSDAKQTTYQYDCYDNRTAVTVTGQGTTSYSYDIYGYLLQLQDAGGNTTKYTYDAFGRLVSEKALKANSSGLLYTINYTYSDGTSSCGSCGGDPNKIAKRQIINDDATSTDTLYYKYDLLGRLTGMGTTSSADDYQINYDGTRMTGIVHKSGTSYSLWGNGSLGFVYDSLGRLQREVYPNGRYNEFSYDAISRLTSVKDPFGFVNKVEYDSDMRLWKLTHSTLGTATLDYNTTDTLLTRLTLGNGAYTDYGYDSLQRLNSFAHYQNDSPTSFFSHSWGYDNLGRKGQIAVNLPSSLGGLGNITPSYDDASRLSGEKLSFGNTVPWDLAYAYDTTGNRTILSTDGGISDNYQFVYNYDTRFNVESGQNREIYASTGALQYDFKGNVTERPPLAGGYPFNYTWDAFDRLRSSTRQNGATVNYTYDALGRLLKRTSNSSSSGGTTVNYWLGLNKIAEEQWVDSGADQPVFWPDNEVGTTPEANGWGIYRAASGGSMAYESDSMRGTVLHLNSGSAAANSGVFMLGDSDSDHDNIHGSPWGKAGQGHIGLWLKNADPAHAPIKVGVLLEAGGEGEWNLNFVTDAGAPSLSGNCAYYHLGSGSDTDFNDGQWHYLELDVNSALLSVSNGSLGLDKINGLAIKGSSVYVDDIVISGSALVRTYQGGLGSWGITGWQNQESRVYYHYNDLGTVVATTDRDGLWNFVGEPDHFGNYRYYTTSGSGSRPLEKGLTGKFFDSDSELYYFNARWYDGERGIMLSRSPLRSDFEYTYVFCQDNPFNLLDPTGRCWTWTELKSDMNFQGKVTGTLYGLSGGICAGAMGGPVTGVATGVGFFSVGYVIGMVEGVGQFLIVNTYDSVVDGVGYVVKETGLGLWDLVKPPNPDLDKAKRDYNNWWFQQNYPNGFPPVRPPDPPQVTIGRAPIY